MTIGVLFVCLGNICRSPMAEAIFRQKVKEAGLEKEFVIDSAGTGAWHVGESPHEGTIKVLRDKGVETSGLIARQMQPQDLQKFDYVLVMDESNEQHVRQLQNGHPKAHVCRLLDFAQDQGFSDVPDPYFDGKFERVYALIDAGCSGFLEFIQSRHPG